MLLVAVLVGPEAVEIWRYPARGQQKAVAMTSGCKWPNIMKDPKDPQCVFKEGAGDNGRGVMLRGIGVTRDAPRFEKWLAGLLGEFSAWRGWIGVFGSVCCCCLRRLEAGGFCCLPSCAGGSQVARREGDGPWRHGHGESRHRASARLPNWDRITVPDPQVRNGQPAGECSWRSWRLHLFFFG